MAEHAAEEKQTQAKTEQDSTVNLDIKSLVHSVTKEGVIFLLQQQYGLTDELKKTDSVKVVGAFIEKHALVEDIVSDLTAIRKSLKEADHEFFFDLCVMNKVDDVKFDESFAISAVKCLLKSSDLLGMITMLAAVEKRKDLDSFSGKPVEDEVEPTEEMIEEVKAEMQKLITDTEPGRNFTVNAELVDRTVVLVAYFADREKTITRFTSGKEIVTSTVIPAVEAQAKYNANENRLYIKGGRSQKIRNYLLESFGKVFFEDNTHFTDPNHEVYNLAKVTSGNFTIPETEDLPEEVESASIVEEVLLIPTANGEDATVTVEHGNVESVLREWSSEKLDFTKQKRKSVVIQLLVKRDGKKSKKVKITVTNGKTLKHDPKYSEIVHQCLVEWGLENAAK